MEHSFNTDIAKDYGILEAILLNNIWFWIKKNEANKENFYDGNYWTYNSAKAFKELFPYASQRQIQYALNHLLNEKVIKTGNYNKVSYDRTLWYSFTEKGKSIMQNCKMDDTNLSNGFNTSVQPIPYSKPDINTDINNKKEIIKDKTDFLKELLDTGEYRNITDDLKNSIYEWLDYKKQRKDKYTEIGIQKLVKQIDINAGKYGTSKVIDLIDTCIASNYQGIIFDLLSKKKEEEKPKYQYEVIGY